MRLVLLCGLLHSLISLQMGRPNDQVTRISIFRAQMFGFSEAQVLVLASGAVTSFCAFPASSLVVFFEPEAIPVLPFSYTFLNRLIQSPRPGLRALVSSEACLFDKSSGNHLRWTGLSSEIAMWEAIVAFVIGIALQKQLFVHSVSI
jgi:hypothetical protein